MASPSSWQALWPTVGPPVVSSTRSRRCTTRPWAFPHQDEGLGQGGAVSQGAAHPGVGHQVDETVPLRSTPRPHCLALHVDAGAGVDLAIG